MVLDHWDQGVRICNINLPDERLLICSSTKILYLLTPSYRLLAITFVYHGKIILAEDRQLLCFACNPPQRRNCILSYYEVDYHIGVGLSFFALLPIIQWITPPFILCMCIDLYKCSCHSFAICCHVCHILLFLQCGHWKTLSSLFI